LTLELRDRLAQGSERLFDTTLSFTVWASNPDELDTTTRDLEQRARWIAECLRRLDLEPRRLANHELAELLRRSLDSATGLQPVATDDALGNAADLVAPAAVAESRGSLAIGERLARALVVVRYPARLQPGWLSELQSFEADLDIATLRSDGGGPTPCAPTHPHLSAEDMVRQT